MEAARNRVVEILSNRIKVSVRVGNILYARADGKRITIHLLKGRILETRMTISELEELLGDFFIRTSRNCLVAVWAVNRMGEEILLYNGEHVPYSVRQKKEIRQKIDMLVKQQFQKNQVSKSIPGTVDEFQKLFRSFDDFPVAFCVIEIVRNEEKEAFDFVFQYGNQALAELENIPLDQIVGHRFYQMFENAEKKWLAAYEHVALYGDQLEFYDFSPEIGKDIRVECYQPFPGYCGCLLFDINDIHPMYVSEASSDTIKRYAKKFVSEKQKNI